MYRTRRSLGTIHLGSTPARFLSVPPALAQGTPWLSEPGPGTVNVSCMNQNATQFSRQTTKVKGRIGATGANLAQNTMWFGVNYAISDAVALDMQSD